MIRIMFSVIGINLSRRSTGKAGETIEMNRSPTDRQARLKAALRANLRKRKEQDRERYESGASPAPASPDTVRSDPET